MQLCASFSCIPGVPVPMKVDDGEKTEESAVDGISPHLPVSYWHALLCLVGIFHHAHCV